MSDGKVRRDLSHVAHDVGALREVAAPGFAETHRGIAETNRGIAEIATLLRDRLTRS